MFDHLGVVVEDLQVAKAFYDACLAPLGISCIQNNASVGEGWLVYGTEPDQPFFVVACGRPSFWGAEAAAGRAPIHVAFAAPDTEAVDAFHQAGCLHGGEDNGAPGVRPSTTAYYAAFVLDPDGNNVEAGFREGSFSR